MNGDVYIFWDGSKLSWLRYISIKSATMFAKQLYLILPEDPTILQRDGLGWTETQDFMCYNGPDHLPELVRQSGVNVMSFEHNFPEVAELHLPPVQTSDVLAWRILATRGGTVVDADIFFFKPIPDPVADVCLIKFKGNPRPGYIPVSFMQGRPCEFFNVMFDMAVMKVVPTIYESAGAPLVEWVLATKGESPNMAWLDGRVVFPFCDSDWPKGIHHLIFRKSVHMELPEACCGMHWYAGSNSLMTNSIGGIGHLDCRSTFYSLIVEVFPDLKHSMIKPSRILRRQRAARARRV